MPMISVRQTKKLIILSLFLSTFLLIVLSSCNPVVSVKDSQETPPHRWQLVWSDEFNYQGLPNPSKWSYEEGFVRNKEAQYYTRGRKENARIANGMLIIEARKEKYNKAEYTSASITTFKKASWRYGRFEVKAKFPRGRGMWTSIWLLGTNREKLGWPKCGEIDIVENVGFEPNTIYANVHTQAFNHNKGNNKGSKVTISKLGDKFHVYAVEWFADCIDFFVDDRKYFTYKKTGDSIDEWPFDNSHYLILNAAIGGFWGGRQGIDPKIFPQKFYIDYVRVYKKLP